MYSTGPCHLLVGHPDSDPVAVGHSQLGENVLHVILCGAFGKVQLGGDIAVGQALRDQLGDFPFTAGQQLRRVVLEQVGQLVEPASPGPCSARPSACGTRWQTHGRDPGRRGGPSGEDRDEFAQCLGMEPGGTVVRERVDRSLQMGGGRIQAAQMSRGQPQVQIQWTRVIQGTAATGYMKSPVRCEHLIQRREVPCRAKGCRDLHRSTDEQNLTVQREGLAALGVTADRIYVDHGLTGSNRADRVCWKRLPPGARATRWSSPNSTGWPGPCLTPGRSRTSSRLGESGSASAAPCTTRPTRSASCYTTFR